MSGDAADQDELALVQEAVFIFAFSAHVVYNDRQSLVLQGGQPLLDERRMERNRQWLEAEQARLQTELHSTNAAMDERERPGYGTHMADNATEVFEQTRNLAVSLSLRRTLEDVTRALHKMDEGVYMICDRCGQRIDPARLKALPHAVLCKSCQERVELASRSR